MDEYDKIYVLRRLREAFEILEELENILEEMETISDSDD